MTRKSLRHQTWSCVFLAFGSVFHGADTIDDSTECVRLAAQLGALLARGVPDINPSVSGLEQFCQPLLAYGPLLGRSIVLDDYTSVGDPAVLHSESVPELFLHRGVTVHLNFRIAHDSLGCHDCMQVSPCLDGLRAAAIVSLALKLGAQLVMYRRTSLSELSSCMGQGRYLEAIIASQASADTLDTWFERINSAGTNPDCGILFPSIAIDRHRSDKGFMHNYSQLYDLVLPAARCGIKSVLEVGVGFVEPGASLRAWRDVFPRANVTGFDISPGSMQKGTRLRTHLCNTMNVSQVNEVLREQMYDLIIDDGAHVPLAQLATLRALWPRLQQGQFYFIEDMSTADAWALAVNSRGALSISTKDSDYDWLVMFAKDTEDLPVGPLSKRNVAHLRGVCPSSLARSNRLAHCCGAGEELWSHEACFGNASKDTLSRNAQGVLVMAPWRECACTWEYVAAGLAA